jgi:sugar lactone lactonase YvrE
VALAVAATAACPPTPAGGTSRPQEPEQECGPWAVRPIATDLGVVENLLDDGRGGMLLSLPEAGELGRLTPDGQVSTVVDGLPAPGGLARRGRWAYVTTGLTTESTLQGVPDGAIERVEVRTGRRQTWATGLVGPNGLALLRDGSAVTTRPVSNAGVLSEVTRVPARHRSQVERFWSDLTSTNGAAVDRQGRWLYVSRSLSPRAEVWRIRTSDPQRRELVADLGVGSTEFLDDLTVARDGTVFVAAWGSGKVYRVDPATGATCEIASGLPQVTAVEPGGGGGFPRSHLYVSSFTGTVYELSVGG